MRIGVVGLGQIGHGIATCIARTGMLEALYDVRSNAAEDLRGAPKMAGSPGDVAACCDVVVTAVVDAIQIRDVLFGPNGFVSSTTNRPYVILVSTISLEDLREIRSEAEQYGIVILDCGVVGGALAHERGLVCLIGAEEDQLEKVQPALDAFAGTVIHTGPPDSGMAAKICRNVIIYGVWRTAYEAALLAEAAGVSVKQLATAIEITEPIVGGAAQWLKRAHPATNPAEQSFREQVAIFLKKDLTAAKDLARNLGLSLPMAELTLQSGREILGISNEISS